MRIGLGVMAPHRLSLHLVMRVVVLYVASRLWFFLDHNIIKITLGKLLMVSGDSLLVCASWIVVRSRTTAASAAPHQNHDQKESIDRLSICLVSEVIADPCIVLIRIASDAAVADVLSWSFTKRSKLADRIPAERACDNDCGKFDALCQSEKAAA